MHKTAKFVMIDKYKNFIFVDFLIVLQYFKSFNNGQKFIIVSFILCFG